MNLLHFRILPFAAMLLLTGNNVFAQTTTADQKNSSKLQQIQKQDIATLVNEEAYALPWIKIQESNIQWRKRVWRDIDVTDAGNKAFSNDPKVNPPSKMFINILLEGAMTGKIKVYDAVNDRFTKELTKDDLVALIAPGKDGSNGGFRPEQVNKYRIKEDWLFLKEENKLVVRILGIAPVIAVKNADGTTTDKELFWDFSFGDRDYLAQCTVSGAMNWDKVLTERKFTSKIIKVTNGWTNQLAHTN